MKVLTIKQPFASLIKEEIKHIETRSWKTNYRGEIYIHAAKRKLLKDDRTNKLISYLKDKNFKYGAIIAKANLVDCIYMDEKYIKKISKNKKEYMAGNYSVGRYAWVLDNIEVLNKEIYINGQLGLWNYNK